MTLADLAALGSFVSGVAVLISLIFLNHQIRQASRNQRSLMLQGQAARWLELQIRLAHPEMAPVWNNPVDAEGDLTMTELRQVRHVVTAYFKSGEESFIQHREGLLTKSGFDAMRHILQVFLSFPRVRVVWRSSRELFDADYARLVDRLLEQGALFEPEAALAAFNQAVAAEVARAHGAAAEAKAISGAAPVRRAPAEPPARHA